MSTIADSPFVRLLTVADLPAMVALQKAVTAKLPAGFVRSKTESEVRAYLDGTHGVAYGIVEGSALLAISLLRVPDENHPNAGLPFPLVPEEDWSLCACFLENTMVLPAARGPWISQNPAAHSTVSCSIDKDEVDMRRCSPSEFRELGKFTR